MNRPCAMLTLLSSLAMPSALAAAQQPNVVFILADDLGYGDLACHGNPLVKTPRLDQLRAESVRFTDFQVSPICSPSRCALMTGRHEYRAGVHATRGPGQDMSLKAVTMAQVLKSAGYATGIFGKWHLGAAKEHQPNQRGFDMALSFSTGMIGEGAPSGMGLFDGALWRNGATEKTRGFCTDVFTTEAITWMAGVKSKPFFAYIPYNAPHTPLGCPPEFEKPYQATAPSAMLATYYGMITNLDANVGRILDQLKAWNLDRNTLVIFSSDNGANPHFKVDPSPPKFFNAGMKGAKSSVEEGGTRVASFWRLPSISPGGVDVERLASNIDVFPTLVELAGAKLPPGLTLDGRSLVPLLKQPDAEWQDRFVFIHESNWGGDPADHKDNGFAIRNDQFRLVGRKALYDVKTDRGQARNLASEQPELIATMLKAYDAWWAEVEPELKADPETGGDDGAGKPKKKKQK